MAKHSGGESGLTYTLKPIAPATTGTPINLCITGIDSIEFPKGWQPAHSTCDYSATKGFTTTRRKRTTGTVRWSASAFAEDQLTKDQLKEVVEADVCGPVILVVNENLTVYMPEATVDISIRPGGTEALQTFSISGESEGDWDYEVPTP